VKRLNPVTGKSFKRGETRDDGFVLTEIKSRKIVKQLNSLTITIYTRSIETIIWGCIVDA